MTKIFWLSLKHFHPIEGSTVRISASTSEWTTLISRKNRPWKNKFDCVYDLPLAKVFDVPAPLTCPSIPLVLYSLSNKLRFDSVNAYREDTFKRLLDIALTVLFAVIPRHSSNNWRLNGMRRGSELLNVSCEQWNDPPSSFLPIVPFEIETKDHQCHCQSIKRVNWSK